MLDVARLLVEVRDKNLVRQGAIEHQYLKLKAKKVRRAVGSWELTLPHEHELVETLWTPGSGLIITLDNRVFMSGDTVGPKLQASPEDPAGTVTFQGVDDKIILWDARSWPQPSNGDLSTQTKAYDTRTAVASTLMFQYVNENIGPSAPSSRRGLFAQKLVMGVDPLIGSVIQKSPRFTRLIELLADIAITDHLDFDVVQDGTQLKFIVTNYRDQRLSVRFDINTGTLEQEEVGIAVPELTRALVGGPGEEETRQLVLRTTTESLAAEAAWGRKIEEFVDARSAENTTGMNQAGDEVLIAKGFTATSAKAIPAEGEGTDLTYYDDWRMNDQVTVNVRGNELSTFITEVALLADSSGGGLSASLGAVDGFSEESAMAAGVDSVSSRVEALERTVEVISIKPQPIAAGTNLNAMTQTGVFYQGDPNECTLAKNYPVASHAGTLEVFAWTGALFSTVEQRYTLYRGASATVVNGGANQVLTRSWSSNSGTWTPWRAHGPAVAWSEQYRRDLAVLRSVTPSSPMIVGMATNGEMTASTDGIMWDRMVPEAPFWTRPTFQNSWTNYSTSDYHQVGYLKTAQGIVCLSGMMTAGTLGAAAFTLPVGYRPDAKLMFSILSNTGQVARVDILPTGEVAVVTGSNAWPSLDDIMFPAAGVATWTNIAEFGSGASAIFRSGWTSFHTLDASWPPVSFWVDPLGRVWWRGLVRQTSPGTIGTDTEMLVVPVVGPAQQTHACGLAGNAFGSLDYYASGAVTVIRAKTGTPTNYISLNNLPMIDAYIRSDWSVMRKHKNSWQRYSASFPDTQFIKFSDGIIYVDGLISSGTLGAHSTIIPPKFDPDCRVGNGDLSGQMVRLVNSLGAVGRTDLTFLDSPTASVIVPMTGSNSWHSNAMRYIRGGV